MGYPPLNCPHCNQPIQLVHITGKPTLEMRKLTRSPSADPPPGDPPPDDDVSIVNAIVEGFTDDDG
jgi:hypothetical protein